MCFSEQYYFFVVLNTFGMLTWMIGLQTILVNQWNIFDDPAGGIVFVATLMICKAAHIATITTANYLRIWEVPDSTMVNLKHTAGLDQELMGLDGTKAKPGPKPPPNSTLSGWPEP